MDQITSPVLNGTPRIRWPEAVTAAGAAPPADSDDRYSLAATKRLLLHEVLPHVRGNKLSAAQLMGVSPRTLYRMIERYGVTELMP